MVQLLGHPRVEIDREWIEFLPDRRFKLLAYLAYAADWVSRDRLAALFWSERTDRDAKHNLRQVLKRTRKLRWLTDLEADRYRLRWRVETDVMAFHRALDAADEKALASLYRGPLLQGFDYDLGAEFEGWLDYERQRLHRVWRSAFFRLARDHTAGGRFDGAARLYATVLANDGYDEEALQAFMRLSTRTGRESQALDAYRAFRKRLRRDLGMDPTSSSQRLFRSLEGDSDRNALQVDLPVGIVSRAPSRLPAVATSFIGRELELAEITHLLTQPECRLLTIVGIGGVGKTRTALQAAGKLKKLYPAGISFVPLEEVDSPTGIAPNLAEAVGLSLGSSDPSLNQLASHIGDRAMLLVLDGFEHLLAGAATVSDLVAACPNLSLLATSREPLDLEVEWLFPLHGLPVPQAEVPHDDALTLDAVRLFVERARRVNPHLSVTIEDTHAIATICRRVEGSPLGIELAAVWMRYTTPADIARQLEQNLDVLTVTQRDRAERHRSIRATFEHSWKLLTGKEREALRKLSVFRGGFGPDAAAAVADATIAVLAALVDKSLLQSVTDGRFDCHPLIFQYAKEKLSEHPAERTRTEQRHSRFFFHLVKKQPFYQRHLPQNAGEDLATDFANIRAALTWSLENRRLSDLPDVATELRFFFQSRGRLVEAVELFDWAIADLRSVDAPPAEALGALLINQAWLYQDVGRRQEAIDLVLQGVELLRPLGLSEIFLEGLGFYGGLLRGSGAYADSKIVLEEAIALLRPRRHPRLAWFLQVLAITERTLGNYDRAEALLEEALALHRDRGDGLGIINNLRFLAHLKLDAGRPREAIPLLEAMYRENRETDRYLASHALRFLGQAHCDVGSYQLARDYLQEALELVRTDHHRSLEAPLLGQLARVSAALGDDATALEQFRRSIRLALSSGATVLVLQSLTYLAAALVDRGRGDGVGAWMQLVAHHQATAKSDRDRAEELLARICRPSAEQVARQSAEAGPEASLESVVAEVLEGARLDD